MKLSGYRPHDRSFEEHLRYVLHDGNGVVRTKPNGYLVGYDLRGPDFLGTSWDELTYHADAFATTFGALDSRWCMHFSVFHSRGGMYPTTGAWPDRTVYLLDQARRARYQADGDHFLNETRLWLSWQPNSVRQRVTDWLFGVEKTQNNEREAFDRSRNMIASSLEPLCKQLTPIDFEEVDLANRRVVIDRMAQRLGEEIYGRFGMIDADPSEPLFLSHFLAESIELQPDLKIGGRYIGILSIRGYPRFVSPSMLDALRYLPIEFRYSVRIMPYSMPEAATVMHNMATRHRLATLGIGLITNAGRNGEEEETPLAWHAQVRAARANAQAGESYCSVLPQLIVYGDTIEERDAAIEMARVAISQSGFTAKLEDRHNAFFAYLASLPGERDANELRYARSSVRAATRLCTLTSTWHGSEQHPDRRYRKSKDDAPLLMMSTPAREPFRLHLHVGEVGHTLIVGRTGRGKSVLLRALENAHLGRYKGARVISFDIGRSAYKFAHAIHGRHYTLQHGAGPQIAPLSGLDDLKQFDDILDWLVTFSEVWLDRGLDIRELDDLRVALEGVRNHSHTSGRRLSDCGHYAQNPQLRKLFEQVQGSLLDAKEDNFSFDTAIVPYWCYELGGLGIENARWTTPTILYLQRRAFSEFANGDRAPTLVTLDEGARALRIRSMQPFAERLEREGRKNRVQFIFATQGVGEILTSPIRDVLIESTPTKIALANREATQTTIRDGYVAIGFREDDIATIAEMGEYDVLVRNEYGVQVVQLNPTSIELALFGGASNEDCERVDLLIERYGPTRWLQQYLLQSKDPSLHTHAATLRALEGDVEQLRSSRIPKMEVSA